MVFSASQHGQADISDLDYLEQLRVGHPQIADEDAYIIERVKRRTGEFQRPLRVFILHGRTGVFAAKLLAALPEIELVVHERHGTAVKQLNSRFADTSVKIFSKAFEEWNQPVDVLLSRGIHHHVPRGYLEHVRNLLGPEGILILSDEFCPEYCVEQYAERILSANQFYLAGGYVLTTAEEIAAYERDGEIPPIAKEMELFRQQALWTWYKYVVDYAMERNCLNVAVEELRAAQEDLQTKNSFEHKLSPMIVERELELQGYVQRSKYCVAPHEPVKYQSFFVYEYSPKA
jgi:SAM-dependent methyltransferase